MLTHNTMALLLAPPDEVKSVFNKQHTKLRQFREKCRVAAHDIVETIIHTNDCNKVGANVRDPDLHGWFDKFMKGLEASGHIKSDFDTDHVEWIGNPSLAQSIVTDLLDRADREADIKIAKYAELVNRMDREQIVRSAALDGMAVLLAFLRYIRDQQNATVDSLSAFIIKHRFVSESGKALELLHEHSLIQVDDKDDPGIEPTALAHDDLYATTVIHNTCASGVRKLKRVFNMYTKITLDDVSKRASLILDGQYQIPTLFETNANE